MRNGDFLFGNPSSLHQTGKRARKFVNETMDYLYHLFHLDKSQFDLIFHSGATEGINTFFKGLALQAFSEKKRLTFFFGETDHACVVNLKSDLELLGHGVQIFGVDRFGQFDSELLIMRMTAVENPVLNFTAINNETGVVWPMSKACQVKQATGCLVHVDAVQLVGKIEHWENLEPSLDGFTFSGHKFGALKGCGFTFMKKNLALRPLIVGGSQQSEKRAGTENALSVYSLKLALQEIHENFSASSLRSARDYLEQHLIKMLGNRGEIIAAESGLRNLNTLFVLVYGQKAESMSMKFDIGGIDVSTGSACSSGIIKENRILTAMGYSPEDSRSAIRFSFSPFMSLPEAQDYFKRIEKIFLGILK